MLISERLVIKIQRFTCTREMLSEDIVTIVSILLGIVKSVFNVWKTFKECDKIIVKLLYCILQIN